MRNFLVLAAVFFHYASLGRAFVSPVFRAANPLNPLLEFGIGAQLQMSQTTTIEEEAVAPLSPEKENTKVVFEQSNDVKAIETKPEGGDNELSETQKLMKQVKEAGVAGIASYALWELGFWSISVRAKP
jgi:hypothetical protein